MILKGISMNSKTEGTMAIIASIIVLFSAMWNPVVSAAVSVIAMLGFGIYKFLKENS